MHGPAWSVRADVRDCPDLELVLPARKEAVENAFLAEMREAARLAIYRAMADDPSPRPAFADRERARKAGIEIPEPPPMLRPWRPALADADDWRDPPAPAIAAEDALVMAFDPEPPEAHALWRAAARVGISSRLFEADDRLAGYGWHDSLSRVTSMTVRVADGAGEWTPAGDIPAPERAGTLPAALPPRPEGIRVEMAVRPPSGRPAVIDLPADLAWFLAAAFFAADDDVDADSRETQRDRFEEEALHLATRLLVSDDDACRNSLADAVRRELMWLCPKDRDVEIRIRRPDVTVTLGDAAQET